LFAEYTQEYGMLKETVPVYFYLYPRITLQQAIAKGKQRTQHEEGEPGILMVKIEDIEDLTNLTFTLNDSFTAYWQKANEAGIKSRGPQPDGIVLPDHNKVFPFAMIEDIHRKYAKQNMIYEVQIWDYELLERMRYTIFEVEKP
jgi:hypothetical protein